MRTLLLPLAGLVLSAGVTAQSTAWNTPPVAPDVNPDPNIVEVFLEASETTKQFVAGQPTTVWAYNGTIPGPTIVAEKGNTLIVHFTNNLPEETTIHWHGVENIAGMDGGHLSQLAVPGNGGTFDYEFPLNDATLFWYHPHIKTNEQVEKGLYGALLVRDPAEDALLGTTYQERIVMYDDILLDENNQIEEPIPSDPVGKVEAILNGRLGNYQLINGVPGLVNLQVQNGVVERWRMVNVANTRFMRLSWENPNLAVWRVGGDAGLIESPELKSQIPTSPGGPGEGDGGPSDHTSDQDPTLGVFLTPGERADIMWTPVGPDGTTVLVRNHDWNRGAHNVEVDPETGNIILGDVDIDGTNPPVQLIRLTVNGDPTGKGQYTPPDPLKPATFIDPLDVSGTLTYVMGHTPPPLPPDGSVVLFVQAMATPFPKVTSLIAHDVMIDDTMEWQVTNLTHMDHPFHTHGFFFQPYELEYQDDVEPENSFIQPIETGEFHDTFRIPGRIRPEPFTSRFILRARTVFSDEGREGMARAEGGIPADDLSGGWLAHCHILEHSTNGMLTYFEARYDDQTVWHLGAGLAGTAGIPKLRIDSAMTGGASFDLTLENAAPNATTGLFIGLGILDAPFKGGSLLPNPDFLLTFATDSSGEFALSDVWPQGIAPGGEIYWHMWTQDNAAPNGLSASNALKTIAQ